MDDVLLNKAAIIERCLGRISEEYRGHEHELNENFSRQDAIVLNLQRACEAAIDADWQERVITESQLARLLGSGAGRYLLASLIAAARFGRSIITYYTAHNEVNQ